MSLQYLNYNPDKHSNLDPHIKSCIIDACTPSFQILLSNSDIANLIDALWDLDGSEFHHSHCKILLDGDKLAATVTLSPVKNIPDARKKNFFQMLAIVDDRKQLLTNAKKFENLFMPLSNTEGYYISSIAVPPSMQGNGNASTLMDNITDELRNNHVKQLSLDVYKNNTPALALYHKHNFIQHSSTSNDSTDYIRMTLSL